MTYVYSFTVMCILSLAKQTPAGAPNCIGNQVVNTPPGYYRCGNCDIRGGTCTGNPDRPLPSTECAFDCAFCPAGYYCIGGGGYPLSCKAGTYSLSKSSACTLCAAGTYSSNGAQQSCPNKCPAGTWGIPGQSTLATACIYQCSAGRWGNVQGAASEEVACSNLCPSGTWSDTLGLSSASQCNLCAAGSWGAVQGAVSKETGCPNLCAAGTWSTGAGLTSAAQFNSCPLGTWGTVSGATTQTDACNNLCPSGTYGIALGQTSQASACLNCESGKFSAAGITSCSPCATCQTGNKNFASYVNIISPPLFG